MVQPHWQQTQSQSLFSGAVFSDSVIGWCIASLQQLRPKPLITLPTARRRARQSKVKRHGKYQRYSKFDLAKA